MNKRIVKEMTAEKMTEIYTDNDLRNAVANPTECCDCHHHFLHLKAVTYPVEYIVTQEQVAEAKAEKQRAKDKVFAEHYNDLLFVSVGWPYPARYEDDVCNHRICTEVMNRHGHRFFIEICHTGKSNMIVITATIDRDKQIELNDANDRQTEFYNYHRLNHKDFGLTYTKSNILQLINREFDCCFKNIVIDQRTIWLDDRAIICESPKQ